MSEHELGPLPVPNLVERLRTDVLWHRRRGNETIAQDCEQAAIAIEAASAQLARYWAKQQERREELVAAWNDLPDLLRCHPGLKRLYAAAQKA